MLEVTRSRQATRLDSTYSKAFARMATAQHALGEYSEAVSSWRRALELHADEARKKDYIAGLEASMAKVQPPPTSTIRLPWEVAAMMLPRLSAKRTIDRECPCSSAWVIYAAHEEFMNGIRKLGTFRVDKDTGAPIGMLGCVIALSNGLLRDHRVAHSYPELTKLEQQLIFECESFFATCWIETDPSPKQVIQGVSEHGWDIASRAASFIVRAWIIRGQLDLLRTNRYDVAIGNCERCLLVIRQCRQLAPPANRGVFMEDTFLFGVQTLMLEMLVQKYSALPLTPIPPTLKQEADSLLLALDCHVPDPALQKNNPAFFYSFLAYPRGTAHSARGLVASRADSFHEAAEEYLSAARYFPADDEKHCYNLRLALINMKLARSSFPRADRLAVMAQLRSSVPAARAIWEHLSLPRPAAGLCSQGCALDELRMEEEALLQEKD
ncbi:hypothetical protein MIND_00279700 [Mycena indigotica]|uniref:TPR-like protein n=1 Tax=Mycena indigotica TaxID=2126181 RepID=A0A8H6TB71_9AGAR|nr:uncharacterized protein MIND_00279700 [Mycena indigotica]KAF7312655.1 hypothetical protein MIND_00279700 [Mycena indigotica]